MGGTDKLLASLAGRPVLSWSLDAVRSVASVQRLIVVTRADRVAQLRGSGWVRRADAEVVVGGGRRQESVAAGVRASRAELVLVHDGARPLIRPALVEAVVEATRKHGAAIPVIPVAETLKRITDDGRIGETVERLGLATAQTPQGVRRDLLLAAYGRHDPGGKREFTDEAALLEADGIPVAAVDGDPANLKITRPADLEGAEAWLVGQAGGARLGQGFDRHAFGAGDGLALGGIVLREAPRLEGHSDGDAALHAIADAMLGVAGLGDIGRLFPAHEVATSGIASGQLLADVADRVRDAGWVVTAVDLNLLGARPRFGAGRLDAMRDAIGELLGLDGSAVSVKASTGNLSGDEGAGRVISASALVTLVRRAARDPRMDS